MASRRAPAARAPTIPKTMKAAAIDRFGPPSVLTLHERPVPEIDDNEVLIALHTAGVGSWDAKIRDGTWAEEKTRVGHGRTAHGSGADEQSNSRTRA